MDAPSRAPLSTGTTAPRDKSRETPPREDPLLPVATPAPAPSRNELRSDSVNFRYFPRPRFTLSFSHCLSITFFPLSLLLSPRRRGWRHCERVCSAEGRLIERASERACDGGRIERKAKGTARCVCECVCVCVRLCGCARVVWEREIAMGEAGGDVLH